MGRKGGLVTLGEVLAKVLRDSGLGRTSVLAKIQSNWPKAAGKTIAAHAFPEALRDGRLTIVVDSSAWMNQLSMLSPSLLENIRAVAPEVAELRFKAGKPEPRAATTVKSEPVRKNRPEASEAEDAARAASTIKDPAVRDRARRFLIATCTRKKG